MKVTIDGKEVEQSGTINMEGTIFKEKMFPCSITLTNNITVEFFCSQENLEKFKKGLVN